MWIRSEMLRRALVAGAIIGGLGELALLQGWRVREWLLRRPR